MLPKLGSTTAITNASLVTTAETVVATLQIPGPASPSAVVLLEGYVALLTGTGTTGVTVRLRQNSVTGTVVATSGVVTQGVAAGAVDTFSINGQDTPGDVASMIYVLTVQQAGASANGTVNAVALQSQSL